MKMDFCNATLLAILVCLFTERMKSFISPKHFKPIYCPLLLHCNYFMFCFLQGSNHNSLVVNHLKICPYKKELWLFNSDGQIIIFMYDSIYMVFRGM